MPGPGFKLDSEKLRQYLGAVSGLYGAELRKRNLNPMKLIDQFYNFFQKEYSVIIPSRELYERLEKYRNESKDFMIFDLYKSHQEWHEGWIYGTHSDYYLFIGEKKNGEFFAVNVEYAISTDSMGNPIQGTDGQWNAINQQDVNFINLTLDYHRMIIDVCKKWGYERIIKYIKDACIYPMGDSSCGKRSKKSNMCDDHFAQFFKLIKTSLPLLEPLIVLCINYLY